jgi:hypothetical protein
VDQVPIKQTCQLAYWKAQKADCKAKKKAQTSYIQGYGEQECGQEGE